MNLSIKDLGMIKNDYNNDNPLNICTNIKEVKGSFKIEEKDKVIIETLTNPDRVSRIILQENNLVAEKYGYLKGNHHVYVENLNGKLSVGDTEESLNKALFNIAQFIGMSELTKTNFEITLKDGSEVILLTALIDIYREKSMLNICGQEMEMSAIFAEIREHIDNPNETSLTYLFKENFEYGGPEVSDTKKILDSFVKKRLIVFDDKYQLTGELEALADSFLLPEITILADIMEVEKKNVKSTGILYVSAGIKNNLIFAFGSDGIEISTISSVEMYSNLLNIFNCPKL